MSMRLQKLKKDMTPRQRCAIVYPIADSGALPHARHHRRNGNVQSILTLDVAEIGKLKGATKDILARSLDGWYGIWHARVSMHPVTHLDEWDEVTIGQAKLSMMRCVGGVGLDDGVEVHNGADLQSIHVYKWATLDELKLSLEELLGKTFADLPRAPRHKCGACLDRGWVAQEDGTEKACECGRGQDFKKARE